MGGSRSNKSRRQSTRRRCSICRMDGVGQRRLTWSSGYGHNVRDCSPRNRIRTKAFPTSGDRTSRLVAFSWTSCGERHRRSQPLICARSCERGDVLLCIIRHLKVSIVPPGIDGANVTQGTVRLRPSAAISMVSGPVTSKGPSAQAWMKARYFGKRHATDQRRGRSQIPIPVAPIDDSVPLCSRSRRATRTRERRQRGNGFCSVQQAKL